MKKLLLCLLLLFLCGVCGACTMNHAIAEFGSQVPASSSDDGIIYEAGAGGALDTVPSLMEEDDWGDWNPYVRMADVQAYEPENSGYDRLVSGILHREKEIFFLSEKEWNKANYGTWPGFPLMSLIETSKYDAKTQKAYITYAYEEETHRQIIDSFAEEINFALEFCLKDVHGEEEKALMIYTYVISNFSYLPGEENDLCHTFLSRMGADEEIAGVYAYLLMQAGITCWEICGVTENNEGHNWVLVKLGDQYFHCDPGYEIQKNQGKKLEYFGMTDNERLQSNILQPFGTGSNFWYTEKVPNCNDDRFQSLHVAAQWRWNEESGQI